MRPECLLATDKAVRMAETVRCVVVTDVPAPR
jgi:hypothetical protein